MTTPNLDFLKSLVEKTRIELPKIERKPVTEQPVVRRTRDLKGELELDGVTADLFNGLRDQQMLLRKLQGVREPGAEVTMQIDTLATAINEIKAAIRGNTALYGRWIAGPLSAEDELAVSVDLAERGVLTEIEQEDATRIKEAWKQYNELQRMGKDGDDESTFPRPQTVFTVREITGANAARSRFFVKRVIPQGEQHPDGYGVLMSGYAAHFRQKREHYRQMSNMAGEMLKDLKPEEGKTLKDVEAGSAVVVAFEVSTGHSWLGQDQRPLTGTVVIKCFGAEDGVAKLQIAGAVGSIYHSLRRHIPADNNEGTVFAYKAGRAFEGMSRADTGQDQPWLRALLAKVAGFNTSGRQRGPSYAPQFVPGPARGERGEGHKPRQAKGRREKGERGGGKSRTDAGRFSEE